MPANRFEILAAWYLRFNGYFTTANFTIHPDYRNRPGGTDADIIAVRFPHSEETPLGFQFERDDLLVKKERIDFLICEVKTGLCDLNETWRNPERKNVEYAIRWMGFEQDADRINGIAQEIYKKGAWERAQKEGETGMGVRFVYFGGRQNIGLKHQLPLAQEILHGHVINYLRRRFCTGSFQPVRDNWDKDIIEFAALCRNTSPEELQKWAAG